MEHRHSIQYFRPRPRLSVIGAISLCVTAALSILTPRHSDAAIVYLEVAGGLSSFQSGAPFFGSTAPASSLWSFAYNSSFFYTFGNGRNPLDLQLGVQARFSNGWDSGPPIANYSLVGVYPVIRLQLSKLYLGVGATPYLWNHVGPDPSQPLTTIEGSFAGIAEAGFLWAITPEFSLGLGAAAQFVSTNGVLSPSPFLDLTASMRFYFGSGSAGDSVSKSGSNEFKGWRYPFGYMK